MGKQGEKMSTAVKKMHIGSPHHPARVIALEFNQGRRRGLGSTTSVAHFPALSHHTEHSIKDPFEEEPSPSSLEDSDTALGSLSWASTCAKNL